MAKKITLNAQSRTVLGRKVKALRAEGLLPANVYGKDVKSLAVQVKLNDFTKIYDQAGETGIVDLDIKGGKKSDSRAVLISNIQTDPVTDVVVHIDFRQVNLKEKVTASVPVETVGESPAEKQGLGTVVVHIDELEVEGPSSRST